MIEDKDSGLADAHEVSESLYKNNGLVIYGHWPSIIRITREELDILELFMGDLLDDIAANDNEVLS